VLEANAIRFGNYIGEPGESDVEEEAADDVKQYMFDDEAEEEAPEVTGQELMELDGKQTALEALQTS